MKVSEIKQRLQQVTMLTSPFLQAMETDDRQGVQQAVRQTRRRLLAEQQLQEDFQKRFHYEKQFWEMGQLVAGIDEVGRGPLAGPVVAAAVILPHDFAVLSVNDSKQLSDHKRRKLVPLIKQQAISYSSAVVSSEIIDQLNIYEATRLAMKKAVLGLLPKPNHLLVDAMTIDLPITQTKIIKGDTKSNSIAAASIIAKVTRDDLMIAYDQKFPGYGFAHNDGYGTQAHLTAMNRLGITPIHRRSFAPVKKLLG
ncbi:ribonuclease HII [Fructilactobacillus florum]|uniref:Ribonuclease HII n=1 Tax=Fructilactobacillus florum DSM 22689 = JCM 16035 TaxID=1423745 RepID=A0A0R2CIM5_9LACO|nr:ribonuclease HII [Fructilactobacillus florum]KRM91457.1 ribonuclease HII [Fructilactobacillus florum DSM 22689 = JCM 16035]